MKNPLSLEILTGIFRTSPKEPSRIINREGTTIEFKESYNHGNMSQYFKAMAAFANTGGYILFGVGDRPRRLLGLKDKSLSQFEELKVEEFTKALLDYFSPEIKWDHCTFEFHDMSFGVIYVYPLTIGGCTEAATAISKPGEDAETEVERRGTPYQNAPPLRPWRLSGKHCAGADRYDGRGGERLSLPRSKQRGSEGIFEKTSRGRGCGIIPLFTRAHLYTLSGVVRSAEGL